MITFLIAVAALFAGYFIYGKFVERVFGVDPLFLWVLFFL